MMRQAVSASLVCLPAGEQRRFQKLSTITETLKPIPGHSAGTMNVGNEIGCNPDADEERKRPIFRMEVVPKKPEHSHMSTMYKWGYHSLSLFRKVNEWPGQWWNANATTLTSSWAQIGDYGACGLWSGVWRLTYGQGQYNMKPGEVRAQAFGRRDKAGAIHMNYAETVKEENLLVAPHLPEHQKHRRFKNPDLKGASTVEPVKGKRIERECQYHLGQSIRFYLVDGYFGSHPSNSTIFRVITDNADHAYAMSMYANRQSNIHAFREMPLLKRLDKNPMDEWAWRRPGVLMLHCPGYDFESPRIVEEFGGPRPQDLNLSSPKFQYYDPYSIPMKACIGAQPATASLVDGIAFLAARWGYYADDKEQLTIPGEAVMSADGSKATLIVDATGKLEVESLRRSPFLYGSRHFRLADGVFTRAWDAVELNSDKVDTKNFDYVEDCLGRIHRPLPLAINPPKTVDALSHRFHLKRRNVTTFGYKRPHNYTSDAGAKATAAGMLFKPKSQPLVYRPAALKAASVNVVIVGETASEKVDFAKAGEAVVQAVSNSGFLYADAEPLGATVAKALEGVASVKMVSAAEGKSLVAALAKDGAK